MRNIYKTMTAGVMLAALAGCATTGDLDALRAGLEHALLKILFQLATPLLSLCTGNLNPDLLSHLFSLPFLCLSSIHHPLLAKRKSPCKARPLGS